MDNTNYRSMDLLWETKPKTAQSITQCYGVILSVSMKLFNVSSLKDMRKYKNACCHLKEFVADNPENYLDFKDINEAWKTFNAAAEYLATNKIKERYLLFSYLVESILLYDSNSPQNTMDLYNHPTFEYMAKKLEISQNDSKEIGEKVFNEVLAYPIYEKKLQDYLDYSDDPSELLSDAFSSGVHILYLYPTETQFKSATMVASFIQQLHLPYYKRNLMAGIYNKYENINIALNEFIYSSTVLNFINNQERFLLLTNLCEFLFFLEFNENKNIGSPYITEEMNEKREVIHFFAECLNVSSEKRDDAIKQAFLNINKFIKQNIEKSQ